MAPGSFVWTDKESELLLNVVLEYKGKKNQQSIDWESCQSKYGDILALFLEQYPAETSNDFPHARGEGLTRTILTTKVKAIRNKYRRAIDSGRRSGFGRVVLLYFEQCEEIWGGSPAATTTPSDIEMTDLDDSLPVPFPSMSSLSTMEPPDAVSDTEQENSVAPTVKQRRDQLQAKLKGHRHERLKRKLTAETLWLSAVEEDQRMNERLVDLLETSERNAAENMAKMINTLNTLSKSIAEGFSLLRQVMQPPPVQPAHYMPYDPRPIYSHTPSPPIHPNQTFHSFPNNSQNTNSSINNTHDASLPSTPESMGLTGFSYTRALFRDNQ